MNFNNDVDMDLNLAIDLLYQAYPEVARSTLQYLIEDGIMHYDLTVKLCYDGLRMALSEQFGRPETFTVSDVAAMLGTTEDEVLKGIRQIETETPAPQA